PYFLPSISPSLCLNTPTPTDIYTLSLHDALPICKEKVQLHATHAAIALGKDQSAYPGLPAASATCIFNGEVTLAKGGRYRFSILDRKSTRLNSSHSQISYAVFCLKKKNHMASLCS